MTAHWDEWSGSGLAAGRGGAADEAFAGILAARGADDGAQLSPATSAFLGDLRLNQIIESVVAGKDEYDLVPLFYRPLRSVEAVEFRQAVMRDLELPRLFDDVVAFAAGMRLVRDHLAQAERSLHELQQDRWFLDAAARYCDAVGQLLASMEAAPIASRGLLDFREYLASYVASERFTALAAQSQALEAALAEIRYGVLIRGRRVDISRHGGEPDYSAEIKTAFERFRQGDTQQYNFKITEQAELNHIELRILTGVAELYPETFSKIRKFRESEAAFIDPAVGRFDREAQFYVSYLEHIGPLKRLGLAFCYPDVSDSAKAVLGRLSFDLALAGKLAAEGTIPVCNDFHLQDPERILVVSGPNQGGKTTFARSFAQLHYLASLGLPVPGTEARLFLADAIFTHFEKEEYLGDLRGKLEDDILRIHGILTDATPRSVIVINEIFSSTALRDATSLSYKIAEAVASLDAICVWVTFIDEIGSFNEKTVSMVSAMDGADPNRRTFKLARRPADGLAYAMSIAERHGLSYERIKERLRS